jgi:nascent polypeptide-associated complex subunit alpha
MMPGLGGMDPKHMAKLMQQMGIKTDEVNATRVIIEKDGANIVIENPQITKISMKGESTYQISGKENIQMQTSQEDINLVMQSCGASETEAKEALKSCNGDIAEAILTLQKKNQDEKNE